MTSIPPNGGFVPPLTQPPPRPPRSGLIEWVHRNKVLSGVIAAMLVIILVVAGTAVYSAVAPANDLLPSVPNGWTRLVTITSSSSSERSVTLHHVQLRICWVIKGSDVANLSYQIGSPLTGPTQLYGANGNTSTRGCVFDLGHDTGTETFAVTESGIGQYAVSLDEQLSPGQEQALAKQAQQQAAEQAKQAQQQAAQQAKDTAEQSVNSAAAQVATDLSSVTTNENGVKTQLASIAKDLTQEQSELTTTQTLAASTMSKVHATGANQTLCDTAQTVADDAQTVRDDAQTVSDDLASLKSYVTTLQKSITSLKTDEASYTSVAKTISGYSAPSAPTPQAVQAALASGSAELSAASAAEASAPGQAQQLIAAATTSAQAAKSAACL